MLNLNRMKHLYSSKHVVYSFYFFFNLLVSLSCFSFIVILFGFLILTIVIVLSFKKIYLFIFREGREGDREGEKKINVQLLGVMACNPGMCPDWESNKRHFGSQPMLNPLSYASQGVIVLFISMW
ncbi:hypothetical protein HJG60_008283 [Phyllostomus discolor]|uniref:Uncharacterized protein n=1 Tax=Phyllostomus discolor TaxID=89673 RepID=A0A833Z1J6_9CHIR|nr:hypothetical protein HJG60_008283 [Phyllostomus discolor]